MLTISRRTTRTARVAALLLLTGLLGACSSASINEPTNARSVHASQANHDDPPPDQPCASGWQEQDGKWVCPNGL
jgi:hypothetical protein